MSELEPVYAAVLSISLTDAAGSVELQIPLLPADTVELENGRIKQLRNCTLAELGHYATRLEERVWSTLAEENLSTLFSKQGAMLFVTLDEDVDDTSGEAVGTLSVELEIDAATDREPTESVEPEPNQGLALESVEEESSKAEPGQPESDEGIPDDVSVSPTEPIFEGPEAFEISKQLALPPYVAKRDKRVLGRRRPLNHSTSAAVDILVNETAFRDAQAHALSSFDHEVAGVLVGPPPEKQPDGRYVVHVSDTIVAAHTRMHGASVTYTPESWRYIHDRLEELYPKDSAVIVGWYHTHPGFGIFLSGMDRFIHRHFFTQIWHIAFVLDPLAEKSGFFCWNREQTEVDDYTFPWPQWAAGSW